MVEKVTPSHKEPFEAVLIFGPPGCGKGTQGKFLSSGGNHYHLSSGDIFRGLSPESHAGQLFHKYAGRGHLLPDEVTIEIWHHYVHGLIATNRYFPNRQLLLLDGLPRTLHQAEILDQYLKVQKIILLEAKDMDVFIQRIKRRGMIERRLDDQDEKTLIHRMQVYEKETHRVLEHYPKDLVSRFHADQKPLEVLRDILVDLSDLLS
ncbi:MAG: nucleoside monophosphate kinase [Simkaniaceae bacterium]